MATYHLNMKIVRRHQHGGNAVKSAAYVAREKLCDARSGKTYNHSRKKDLVRAELVGTRLERSEVWAKAEYAEKREKAVVAREIVVALPIENTNDANWGLAVKFAEHLRHRLGVIVDVAMHNPAGLNQPRNPHAHLLFSSRVWDEAVGEFTRKTRELDSLKTGRTVLSSLRKEWETLVNHALPLGIPKVSCESHATLGDGLLPKRHMGARATALHRKGYVTQVGVYNDLVERRNLLVIQHRKMAQEEIISLPESAVILTHESPTNPDMNSPAGDAENIAIFLPKTPAENSAIAERNAAHLLHLPQVPGLIQPQSAQQNIEDADQNIKRLQATLGQGLCISTG